MDRFKGTSIDQDARFANKSKKLHAQIKFPPNFSVKVDLTKVRLELLRPWIAKRIVELLGTDDEVLIDYACSMLEQKDIDPRDMQINLTGFLHDKTIVFMNELWDLLCSAQNNPTGIPSQFLDAERENIRRKQQEQMRIQEELKKIGQSLLPGGVPQPPQPPPHILKPGLQTPLSLAPAEPANASTRRSSSRWDKKEPDLQQVANVTTTSSSSSSSSSSLKVTENVKRDSPLDNEDIDRKHKRRRESRSPERPREHSRRRSSDRDDRERDYDHDYRRHDREPRRSKSPDRRRSRDSDDHHHRRHHHHRSDSDRDSKYYSDRRHEDHHSDHHHDHRDSHRHRSDRDRDHERRCHNDKEEEDHRRHHSEETGKTDEQPLQTNGKHNHSNEEEQHNGKSPHNTQVPHGRSDDA